MPFTEFCCRNGGNNLNAGTVDGGSTEPATTPLATFTNGAWDSTTDIFTAAAGTDVSEAIVGRFASLSHDADTNPTTNQFLVARITAMNPATRAITLSASARCLLGTEVATAATGRKLRVGGAWKGPNGAIPFPFAFVSGALTNIALDIPRVNFKNDAIYNITTPGITHAQQGPTFFQGYTSSYGDLGKATIDGGTTGASYLLFTVTSNGTDRNHLLDLIFQNNGATGGISGVAVTSTRCCVVRCVARYMRGSGFQDMGSIIECEAYDCNQSNTANLAGIGVTAGGVAYRCISHHNISGTVGNGYYTQGTNATFILCIAADNSANGLLVNNVFNCRVIGSDFYSNGGDGVRNMSGLAQWIIENSNFIANTGYGVNAFSGSMSGVLINCGFADNAAGETNNYKGLEIGTVNYPTGETPWVDPANGDFRINHALAKGAGRGDFTQIDAVNWSERNTIGYPDIGAAQHQDTGGGGGGGGLIVSQGLRGGMQ